MKQILSVVLCLVLTLMLTACSKGTSTIVPIESLSPVSTSAGVYTPAPSPEVTPTPLPVVVARIEESGMTIGSRINPPMGCTREYAAPGSFSAFLRAYSVKGASASVLYYDGTKREDAKAAAVLDVSLGKKNHEGPAGAIARLYAEYFYAQEEFHKVAFSIGNKITFSFEKWRKGYRLNSKGTDWVSGGKESNGEENFNNYLSSLMVYISSDNLKSDCTKIEDVDSDEIRVGDLFIGSDKDGKTRILMVADICRNDETGEKLMLLVQGGSPAQTLHIVENPTDSNLSPWYSCAFTNQLVTPDLTVNIEDRYRFRFLSDDSDSEE